MDVQVCKFGLKIDLLTSEMNSSETPASVCRTCLTISFCRSLLNSFNNCGESEVYIDMLDDCFGINFSTAEREDRTLVICDECIDKLRSCYRFKLQVINSIRLFANAIRAERQSYELDRTEYQPMTDKNGFDTGLDLSSKNNSSSHSYDESDHDAEPEKKKSATRIRRKSRKKEQMDEEELYENDNSYSEDDAPTLSSYSSDDPEYKPEKQKAVVKAKTHWRSRKKGKSKCKSLRRSNGIYKVADEENLQCKICSKTFLSNRLLKLHNKDHWKNFVCDICSREFALEDMYMDHLRQHVFRESPNRWGKTYSSKGQESPNHWGKTYTSKGQYDTDVVKHSEKNIYILCEICGKAFFNKKVMKLHMAVHTDERIFKCDVCSKSYPRLRMLRGHMKIHSNIKDHMCDVCGEAFVQACMLRVHLKIHEEDGFENAEAGCQIEDISNNQTELFQVV